MPPPSTLKRLRSFIGAVHYMSKFKANLAKLCLPLKPLLKKSVKFLWTGEQITRFDITKAKIAASTEKIHYNTKLEVRVTFDASRSGLGAAFN